MTKLFTVVFFAIAIACFALVASGFDRAPSFGSRTARVAQVQSIKGHATEAFVHPMPRPRPRVIGTLKAAKVRRCMSHGLTIEHLHSTSTSRVLAESVVICTQS